MAIELRKTGISVVGDVPWGTHFCHFYETKQDLLDTLVPYFKAGLESKEFCLWVVSDSDLITVEEAKGALAQAVPDLDRHLAEENIEILKRHDWYFEKNVLNLERVTSAWDAKLKQAMTRGYDGMRASADTFWLAEKDWKDFFEYEKQVNDWITDQSMTVLCTYPLEKSGAAEVLDVVHAHQFAIARRQGEWEVVETPELIQAKAEIKRLNEELEQRIVGRTGQLARAIEELTVEVSERKQSEVELSLAHQRLSYHVENTPLAVIEWDKDLFIKRWSKRAEEVFGWTASEALGRNMYDPDFPIVYEEDAQAVAEIAGQLMKGTVDRNLSLNRNYTKAGNVIYCEWYNSVLRDEHGNVITILSLVHDVTERKQAEEALDERLRFETLVTELSAAFANLSPNEVDREIDKCLQTLVEFLGVDRATFLQFEGEWTTLYRSHSYTVPGIEPLPPPIVLKDHFPWITDQMRRGVTVKWSHVPDDMPEEAAKEKEYVARLGVKSGLNIPVRMAGSVICAIAFTSIVTYRDWPDAMVARLRLVGEIFAAAVERKRAEALLHAKEQEFRAIVENAPDQIIRYDRNFLRVYVNPAVARFYGLPAEALIGKPLGSGIRDAGVDVKEDELEQFRQRIQAVFDTGKSYEYEMSSPMPTGRRYFSIRLFPELDLDGSVINVLGISRDITDRREAEEKLKQSENQLAEAQRLAHVGSWDRDLRSNTVTWSDELYRIAGFQPGGIDVTDGATSPIHPEDRDVVLNTVMSSVKNREPFSFYYRILRPDGEERIVHSSGHIVSDEDGEPIRVFGATQDVTELKRAEEQLKATSEQLRALSAKLQSAREEEGVRMAREIHDELGSALTKLKWDLELLDKDTLQEKGDGDLSNLREKVRAMMRLIDETVDLVKRISGELRPGALDDLGLSAALRLHSRQFQERTAIVTECDCSLEDLELSQEQSNAFFRIFEEALTNILRHAQATLVVITLEENGELVLTIRDNGRGITEAEKADRQSLGLLGMRERANLIGAKVDIAGIAGEGTVVTVRVPISG